MFFVCSFLSSSQTRVIHDKLYELQRARVGVVPRRGAPPAAEVGAACLDPLQQQLLLLFDAASTQASDETLLRATARNMLPVTFPPGLTPFGQPMDGAPFANLKSDAKKSYLETLYHAHNVGRMFNCASLSGIAVCALIDAIVGRGVGKFSFPSFFGVSICFCFCLFLIFLGSHFVHDKKLIGTTF